MVLPLIPIFAIFAMIGGGVTLAWFETLPDHEKDHANELASYYAQVLFEKGVRELSRAEAQIVHGRVRAHFG